MKMRWNLDALYSSFESKEFEQDFKKCDEYISELNDWVNESLNNNSQAVEKIEEYIRRTSDLGKVFNRLISYATLNFSTDAKNEKALNVLEKIQYKYISLTKSSVLFKKWLATLNNLNEIISLSKFLEEYRFYLNEALLQSKYLLSEDVEVIIAEMSHTGSEAWSKLQKSVISTLLIDITIDGEEKQLPLSVVRNMANHKDATVRKKAYEAELAAYKKIDNSIAAALNGIKGEVNTLAKLRGYDSPLDMTLRDSRMNFEILDAMLAAIKESLPSFHKYFNKKAELLGYKNGLPFYDLFAPLGSVDMTYTYEEARDFIVKNIKTFNENMSNFMDQAFENNWIDAEPRNGKRGGAFCLTIQPIKESRVLTNFGNNFTDVTTLAHELGHAYHGYCLSKERILNTKYTMPIGETASIFAETIVINAALKSAKAEEVLGILEQDISSAGQTIVDIYSRFLFESELFKRREDHSLSVNELKDIMIEAQKKAYGDGLDHNYLHPYMWANKPHYYYAERNFYNFPYAFGILFAKGLYVEYLKQGNPFIEKFDQLLAATGKNNIGDVAMMIGIDLTSIEFWRNSLKLIAEDIEKFVKLCDEVNSFS
ncbi:MAG: M3 family oligoendopeptidase [Halanaerobiales bacterium]|nr:M3 family oligoendopeptidase [Halanaerobiales bacterium]